MTRVRVGIICDYLEEGWHSMDLVGDMLLRSLRQVAPGEVHAEQLRPAMPRRWTRVPVFGRSARAGLADRLTGRLWDYPRWLAPRVSQFDVFHVVDHSYAHVVRVLPPGRTVVTCNDVDAMSAAAAASSLSGPQSWLARSVVAGVVRAAHVSCISEAARSDLLALGAVPAHRTSVAYLGVDPVFRPAPAAGGGFDLLHVGSTIPRKRIDLLLRVLAAVSREVPDVRLLRAGGALTPEQRALARALGVEGRLIEMPTLSRSGLAALYARAALVLLPSEREGFGLPVIEAMACGTPVVATDIPALREAGGSAAEFCSSGDERAWAAAVTRLLGEKAADPVAWERRRAASIANAARFDWNAYASAMAKLYVEIARS